MPKGPKVQEIRKTVCIDKEADNALEFLRKATPGGYVLSLRIRQVLIEDARRLGWKPPKPIEDMIDY